MKNFIQYGEVVVQKTLNIDNIFEFYKDIFVNDIDTTFMKVDILKVEDIDYVYKCFQKVNIGEKKKLILAFNSISIIVQNKLLKLFEDINNDEAILLIVNDNISFLNTILSRVIILNNFENDFNDCIDENELKIENKINIDFIKKLNKKEILDKYEKGDITKESIIEFIKIKTNDIQILDLLKSPCLNIKYVLDYIL